MCSQSIASQVSLFESIAPLFEKKPLVIVLSKVDLRPISDLTQEEHDLIYGILAKFPEAKIIGISSMTEEGISKTKEESCESLLQLRAELKLKSVKREEIINRMHVALPKARDDIERPPFVPQSKIDEDAANVPPDEKLSVKKLAEYKYQQELYFAMDPDYTGMDWNKYYTLENNDWCYDIIPEFMDGENIYDWIDPDLEKNWIELENEEAELLRQLAAMPDTDNIKPLTHDELRKLALIRNKKAKLIQSSKMKNQNCNPCIPLRQRVGTLSQFEAHLNSMGIDPSQSVEYLKEHSRGRKRTREEVDTKSKSPAMRRTLSLLPRSGTGLTSMDQVKKVKHMNRQMSVFASRTGRSGPGDHMITSKLPKHLFSGKRTIGSNTRR